MCVLRFRTIDISETVCIVSAFRVETAGLLYSEPSVFRVNLSIGRVYIGSLAEELTVMQTCK